MVCLGSRLLLETMAGHGGCHANCGFHVTGIGDVFTCDVEGGAMVDRGANDGDAERHINRGLEVEQLHGNVSLVVVHGHDQIMRAACGAEEDGVRGDGTFAVDAAGAAGFDCGLNELTVFGAEESVLACVGIEAADGDAGMRFAEEFHGLVAKLDGADDAVGVEITSFAQCDVSRDMDDAEVLTGEEHAGVGVAAELGDVLGVAGEGNAIERDSLFIKRRGDHGVGFIMQTHECGVMDITDSGCAVFGTENTGLNDGIGGQGGEVAELYGERGHLDAGGVLGGNERGAVAEHDEAGEAADGGVCEGFEGDFGANTSGIAKRDDDGGMERLRHGLRLIQAWTSLGLDANV